MRASGDCAKVNPPRSPRPGAKTDFLYKPRTGEAPGTFVARAMELKKILGDAALEDFSVHNTRQFGEITVGTGQYALSRAAPVGNTSRGLHGLRGWRVKGFGRAIRAIRGWVFTR